MHTPEARSQIQDTHHWEHSNEITEAHASESGVPGRYGGSVHKQDSREEAQQEEMKHVLQTQAVLLT